MTKNAGMIDMFNLCSLLLQARIKKFFKSKVGGGVEEEKCLLIHLLTRVHVKTRHTCNSFSFLPFQEDCLLFFALF